MTMPAIKRCTEDRRFVSSDGKDGGGHTTCLTVLQPDGSCSHADEHHRAYIASGLHQDVWAASVVAARS